MPALLSARWAKIAALTLAALVSWLLIRWVDPGSPAIADLQITRLQMATLSRPDIAALDEKQFVITTLPFRHKARFGVARIEVEVANPDTANLGIFIRRARDNYAVYVNGKLAAPAPGQLGDRSTLHGFLPRLVKIVPALLTTGLNKIDILSARNATRPTLREVYVGPISRLEPAYRHTVTVVHDNGEFTALVAGLVLLFALALSSLIRNPALIITIALTLALFLLRELHALWINVEWTQFYRDIYLLLVATALWIACAAFVNEWTNGPATLRGLFAGVFAAAVVLILGSYAVLESCHDAYAASSWIEALTGIGAILFMTVRLSRHFWHAPASAWAELTLAAIGLAMAAALFTTQTQVIPGLDRFVSVEGEAFTKLGALAIIVLIAIGLARHGVGVYRLAALNNETLSRRVAEKERELEANHALLREQERERALTTERGRIMRDVHDGIGSQLLGLLVQARNGNGKPEAMTSGLQAAIDDLYLVVDSLDGIDGSLETALGTFRTRIEPRCRSAGITVEWNVEPIGDTPSIGPAAVLQIYRVLQEAVSNAVRHATPTRLAIGLRNAADPAKVEISVSDDGKGFDPAAKQPAGRGLTNMQRRAASIGAAFSVEALTQGTRVSILLPR